MPKALAAISFACCLLAFCAGPAAAAGNPETAALQVGLRGRGLYAGTVDGVLGPGTVTAVRRLQRRAGLLVDGVPGPRTRAALGRFGRRAPLGERVLAPGLKGWDVAALQFLLAWHGFPSGTLDGHFGAGTEAALTRYQRWAGLPSDGRAGPSTLASLRKPPPRSPLRLAAPVPGPVGDPFGPRGARFHAGVDFVAAAGTPVSASAAGRVVYAGWRPGGWGNVVMVAHGSGVRTMYAHLSRVDVRLGDRVAAGARVGLVGATGNVTGPHLHLEVRLRGAAIDPLTALH